MAGKQMSVMELSIINGLLFTMFIILPVNATKMFSVSSVNRDINNIKTLITNVNTYEKTNKKSLEDNMSFSFLYKNNLIPKDMLSVNPKNNTYVPVNSFGREVHIKKEDNGIKFTSTTYSKMYCKQYVYTGFEELTPKKITVNGQKIEKEGSSFCVDSLNVIEIVK